MGVLKPGLSVLSILLFVLAAVFGASRADAADDKDAIVGRWDFVRSGKLEMPAGFYIRFKANGTFTSKLGGALSTDDGKYKFVSSKIIELDIPGVLYGRAKDEYSYRIDGDVLTINEPTGSIDWEFKRVDTGK
jgi:hypothetical protein